MSFVKQNVNKAPIEDTVFAIVKKAKEAKAAIGAEQVVDATIGSLYNEEGNIVAFDSVFTPYNEIAKDRRRHGLNSGTQCDCHTGGNRGSSDHHAGNTG